MSDNKTSVALTEYIVNRYQSMILSREETSEVLSLSIPQLDRKRKRLEGPHYLKTGPSNSKIQYLVSDIVDYLMRNRIKGDEM